MCFIWDMKKFMACGLCTALLSLPICPALALDITSIQPATASPGEQVQLTGGPFSSGTRVMLGNSALVPEELQPGRITFYIPEDFSSGDYAIFLTDGEDSSQQAFILHLVEKQPVIRDVTPSVIDACRPPAGRVEVQVSGTAFAMGASVLLDGAAIKTTAGGTGVLSASLPPLRAGNHHLQVVNPEGSTSLPFNVIVSDEPSISSISVGDDDVNSYQLIISGQNFLPHSRLLVDGQPIRNAMQQKPLIDNDSVEYVDCGTLHYTRYQVTGELQRVHFRVLNPGGRQSETYEATIR